jgi:hypothetical protein
MPFYNDPQFVTEQSSWNSVSGTATASATTGFNITDYLWKTTDKVDFTGVRVFVKVAPAANSTGLGFALLAGTNTVASGTLGTNSALGNAIDLTVVASNSRVVADTVLSMVVTGTATASAQSMGTAVVKSDYVPVFV